MSTADSTVTVPEHVVMDDSPRRRFRISPAGTTDVVAVTVKGYDHGECRDAALVVALHYDAEARDGYSPAALALIPPSVRVLGAEVIGTLDTVRAEVGRQV